ncbi:hypothetical protein BJY01DRAFT_212441 [Aspergillus pseudoustus]|uniref:Uncharacterized protein n=1 Tax=Aspergillus pseudoustus TaxID=1810923 RepID=A0ABR4K668_9EURO
MATWTNHTTVTASEVDGSTLSLTLITATPPPELAISVPILTTTIWPNGDTVVLSTTTSADGVTSVGFETITAQASTADSASNGGNTVTPAPDTASQAGGQTATVTSGTTAGSGTVSSPSSSITQTPSIESAKTSRDGFSSGTLAGAIVGSIVGSALLTLLLAFLFFRRRRSSPKGATKGLDDDVTYGGIVTDKSAAGFSLAAIIPQPADDETVRRRILTLIDHAGLHVDNYYASGASPNSSQDAIARLNSYNSGYLPAPAATVLGERQTQRQVITHLLIYKLLQAIRPGGELLPPLYAAQPRIENASASTDNALFTWRILTAHLYREGKYNRDQAQTAALTQAAHDIAVDFTAAFAPYALSNFSETDRVTHFSDLAAAATELGVWLFAQPCTFEFVWTKGQTEITLTPRVLKTYDEQGNRLVAPQVLVEGDKATLPRTIFRG